MSYLALARQYRPRCFAEVQGQPLVVRALQRAIETGNYHHAILLEGTRGVGKTTLGRLIVKALNCAQLTEGEPCDTCASCVAINEGRFVDLIEIDAASRTRVEDTRELLEQVIYPPSQGKYKVYLIDEVHMLSTHSFNALLKTIEEPPQHVKFILATTDPEKIPATILSRCLKLTLRPLSEPLIAEQLGKIASQESIAIEDKALQLLARAADGSMRDGLSLLEQARHLAAEALTEQLVADMLGLTPAAQVAALMDALIAGDGSIVVELTEQLAAQGSDFSRLLGQLAEVMADGLQGLVTQRWTGLNDYWLEEANRASWADAVGVERGSVWYQVATKSQQDIALAPSSRSGFTMALLWMLGFKPSTPTLAEQLRYATGGGAVTPAARKAAAAKTGAASDTAAMSVPKKPTLASDPSPATPKPTSGVQPPVEATSPSRPKPAQPVETNEPVVESRKGATEATPPPVTKPEPAPRKKFSAVEALEQATSSGTQGGAPAASSADEDVKFKELVASLREWTE